MNNFERFNFKVVPIGKDKRPYLAWSQPETWCDWEERDDIYPDTDDWYVIPGQKVSYNIDGINWGVFIIDIDNENPEMFNKAVALVKSWSLPRSLLVKTKHGGWHIYYRALAECMPRNCNLRASHGLPIEIKSNVGWVAPNGRDRNVVIDEEIAPLMPTAGTPFGDAVSVQGKRVHTPVKDEDPDFNIEAIPIPEVGAGGRHNKCLGTVLWLKQQGCPFDKAMWWANEFYEKNGRVAQRNELENMWDWESPNSDDAVSVQFKPLLKDPIQEIFPGAVELTGAEAMEARNVFWT